MRNGKGKWEGMGMVGDRERGMWEVWGISGREMWWVIRGMGPGRGKVDGACTRMDEGASGGIINEKRNNGLDMKENEK